MPSSSSLVSTRMRLTTSREKVASSRTWTLLSSCEIVLRCSWIFLLLLDSSFSYSFSSVCRYATWLSREDSSDSRLPSLLHDAGLDPSSELS